MAVHKSQGATMEFVLVDIGRAFSTDQLYDALCRVHTHAHLRLLQRPMAAACTPVFFPRLSDPSRRSQRVPPQQQPSFTSSLQSNLMPDAGLCTLLSSFYQPPATMPCSNHYCLQVDLARLTAVVEGPIPAGAEMWYFRSKQYNSLNH